MAFLSDVQHDAGTSSVGYLSSSRGKAHLSEQCRMAVAEYTGNSDRTGEQSIDSRLAINCIGRARLSEACFRNVERTAEVVVPLQSMDVEEHCP